MNVSRRVLGSLLLLAVAACGGPDDSQQAEIAAELRSLRATLQAKAAVQPASAPQREALTAALAPLRDALQALHAEQRALNERQLGLAQELQRWTQVVSSNAGSAQQAELQALGGRLSSLEQAMAAQEARHAEVEAVLRSALDRTADQLEVFLQRLEGAVPAPSTSAPQPAAGSSGKTDGQPDAPPGATASPPPPAEARRGASDVWWCLLGAAVLTLGWLAWRGLRRPVPKLAAEPSGGMDEGVEQIWAAAELLGEAVGRLRPAEPLLAAPPPVELDDPAAVAESLGFDFEAAPRPAVAGPVTPAPAPAPVPPIPTPAPAVMGLERPETALFVVPLASGDQTRALQALQEIVGADPRVLRRPAPEVLVGPGRVAVRCCLLPSLPPGERANLEQRLRDAVA